MNGTKQDSKAAVFPNQRAHRSDKNRNHTCLKHTRSAASHAGEHIPERRLSRTEHDNGTGSNTDKEYDKHLNARDAADQHEQVRNHLQQMVFVDDRCARRLSEGDYKDQRQRGKSSRESDPEVFTELVFHLAALSVAGGDCSVGDEGEVVAEHGSAHDGGDAERQRKAGGLGNSSGDRHEKRDRSDGGSHGRGDEAGNDKEHSDGILCRNPGEHEIGNALCTAPSDNADKRACGEEDQQHCDDVFVPDALSHEGELFFKRDTAVLQTGDEDRCQKRDDDGDVVEAHRNF